MSKKVQNGTSSDTIYHRLTQFYHWVQNFSTRLQIPRVTIWNNGITRTVGGRRVLSYVTLSQVFLSFK